MTSLRPRSGRFGYSYRSVRRKGLRDGRSWRWVMWPFRARKDPIPSLDQETAGFETEIRHAAETDMREQAQRWQTEDGVLKTEFCQALMERRQASLAFRTEAGRESSAAAAFEEIKDKYFALEAPLLSRTWMHFWLVFIGIAEFVLNASVFQVLGQSRIETYLVALGLAFVIPYLAHWLGQALRQEDKEPLDIIIILGLTPTTVLFGLFALARFRGDFFQAMDIQRLLGLQMTSQEATYLFLLLNILLFLAAMLCSYAGSPREMARHRRLRKSYQAALRSLKKESAESRTAATKLGAAEARYQRARETRGKRYKSLREEALSIKENGEWLVAVYRSANMESRTSASVPLCFQDGAAHRVLRLPGSLTPPNVLDWDCGEEWEEGLPGAGPEER